MSAATTIRVLVTTATVLAMALWVAPAHAQAPNPNDPWVPDWINTDDNRTTTVSAPFNNAGDTPDVPVSPDPDNPPPMVEPEGDAGWIDEVAGHQGVMGVQGAGQKGSVVFWVWNGEGNNSEKNLWVQFDCYVYNGGVAGPSCTAGPPANSVGFDGLPRQHQDIGNGWTRHWREWTIKPQPLFEEIEFTMATAASGGTAVIDNVYICAHCSNEDPNGKVCAFNLAEEVWPPEPVYVCAPPGCEATAWDISGSCPPGWMPELANHEGVIGLPGGLPADGVLEVWVDDLAELEGTKHVACQFDFYMAEGGFITWEPQLPPGTVIENFQEYIYEQEDGWKRCLLKFDVSPPADWEVFRWFMFTEPGSGPVAIDSLIFSSGFLFQDDWFEQFGVYEAGSGLHGQYGWKGWDNNPAFDAYATDVQALSIFHSVDVADQADLVHEYDGFTSGKWRFTAWQYIPSDFSSNGSGQFAGTYLVMMNTYADGGPHAESECSVQMNFVSNDGLLKVYHGNGLNTVNVPYVPDEWVEIQAVIDLDADLTQIYYDDQFVVEYSWTGGVLGGGGGALNIGAVDLFANGSTSVYYDDLWLRSAISPGDLNCDTVLNAFDIDPFVLALTNPDGYAAAYPDCDRMLADINADGVVDAFDIDPFVELLTGG